MEQSVVRLIYLHATGGGENTKHIHLFQYIQWGGRVASCM
jgi:hypothetical protein